MTENTSSKYRNRLRILPKNYSTVDSRGGKDYSTMKTLSVCLFTYYILNTVDKKNSDFYNFISVISPIFQVLPFE